MNLISENSREELSAGKPKRKKVKIASVSQVHEFFGLGKPKHPLISVMPITDEMTNFDYGDVTYLFDLYQISLKKGIKGSISYGRNAYDFQEGTMVFTKPDQSLSIETGEDYQGSSGWTVVFHPDLIRKSDLGQAIDKYSFFSYEVSEALHLSDDEQKTLTELVEKIEKEYSQVIDRHSQELIVSNLKLLLDYCTRYYDRQFYTRTNLNKDFVTQFESLLKEYYASDKPLELGVPTVKYCGETMHMSSHYLSDLLRKETGRGAQDHIYFFLIERAKTQLLNTQESVSQVAYSLGFEYPNHFSKLFKKKTGMSPGEYRNLN
ncbi:MAG TPA: AraC family transcriptional regulator [Cytophagales bacterium]|nr:AraC family transcriptional regulator [Cytophagales bacterium]HAA20545.1 AraC family transcriptional regulator [Cytophagales bacterium]HAP59022.1 AraC family transcriptional regulator [Cytophagales bacterium]